MRRAALQLLGCPFCKGSLHAEFDDVVGEEAISGALSCTACGAQFPLLRGVPRMNERMEGLDNVAKSFGYEWKAHHRGVLEDETLFGRTLAEDWEYFLTATGQRDPALRDAVVLDAGCGSGRLTRQIAEHGAGAVVGVDVNEAVDEAYAATRDLPNVYIVQGNIFALPLQERAFDLVWSNGVIHHTPDAARAHAALSQMVQPGGTLYVWVYPRRFNPFRFVKDIFNATRLSRLPEPALFNIAKALAYPSAGLLWLYRSVRRIPGLRPRTAWGERTVRERNLQEIELTWFDALSPEYDSRHSEEEVIGWFKSQGFTGIGALEEPKVGVRGTAPGKQFQAAVGAATEARDSSAARSAPA